MEEEQNLSFTAGDELAPTRFGGSAELPVAPNQRISIFRSNRELR